MAAAATNSATFPPFSSLPPELRNQIWGDALPDKVGPALYFYRKGYWCPRRLSKSDEGYDPENDQNNLNLEFRHDLLDDIQFEIPLTFVNREARGIALAWVRKQGVEMRPRKDRQYPIFVRPFDPMRDTLYIALDKWDDFLCEPGDRQSQPDLFEQLVDIKPNLRCIAVPEALLRSEVATLPEIFLYYFHLELLFIIVDAQPDQQSADNDMKVQRRWEFESTQGGAFFWDDDRGSFDSRDSSEYIGDKTLDRLIEEANNGLGEVLAENHIHNFEIRLRHIDSLDSILKALKDLDKTNAVSLRDFVEKIEKSVTTKVTRPPTVTAGEVNERDVFRLFGLSNTYTDFGTIRKYPYREMKAKPPSSDLSLPPGSTELLRSVAEIWGK